MLLKYKYFEIHNVLKQNIIFFMVNNIMSYIDVRHTLTTALKNEGYKWIFTASHLLHFTILTLKRL